MEIWGSYKGICHRTKGDSTQNPNISSAYYQMANAVSPGISLTALNSRKSSTCEARTPERYFNPGLHLCKWEHVAHGGNSLIACSLCLLLSSSLPLFLRWKALLSWLVIKYKSPSPIFQRVIKRLSRRNRQDTGIPVVSVNRSPQQIIQLLSLLSHNFKFRQNT